MGAESFYNGLSHVIDDIRSDMKGKYSKENLWSILMKKLCNFSMSSSDVTEWLQLYMSVTTA